MKLLSRRAALLAPFVGLGSALLGVAKAPPAKLSGRFRSSFHVCGERWHNYSFSTGRYQVFSRDGGETYCEISIAPDFDDEQAMPAGPIRRFSPSKPFASLGEARAWAEKSFDAEHNLEDLLK